jgi:hypothetical protein
VDLNVSPDLDAWICYIIVFAAGAWTAVGQISKRLGGIDGIWFFPRTWLLFAAYTAVPVGLFWLLDRTGAISDSSLFAAVLVGFGYERIITGGSQTLQAPGEVSQFWTPFLAYADRVSQLIFRQRDRSQMRLVERVVAAIVEDTKRYADLEALAKIRSPDVKALEDQLAAIDAASQNRGGQDVLERKTRVLYAVMVAVPDGHYLMKRKNIIDWRVYWLDVLGVRSILRYVGGMSVVLAAIATGLWTAHPEYREVAASYYTWRISKTNSSSVDQFRARRQLLSQMADRAVRRRATERLATLLRRPGLPMERVDLILETLLESRLAPQGNPELPALLAQSLRASSVDARTRIDDVLRFLAKSCDPGFDETKWIWKANEGDSTATLEIKIEQWEHYWATAPSPCNANATPADRAALPTQSSGPSPAETGRR